MNEEVEVTTSMDETVTLSKVFNPGSTDTRGQIIRAEPTVLRTVGWQTAARASVHQMPLAPSPPEQQPQMSPRHHQRSPRGQTSPPVENRPYKGWGGTLTRKDHTVVIWTPGPWRWNRTPCASWRDPVWNPQHFRGIPAKCHIWLQSELTLAENAKCKWHHVKPLWESQDMGHSTR